MAEKELKPSNGILFYEEDVKSDKAPDMTGRIHIDCPECGRSTLQRLAGWWHKKNANEYLKVTHSDFQSKGSRDDSRGSRRGGRRDDDRDDDRRGRRDDDRRGGSRRRNDDDDRRGRSRDEDRPPLRDEDERPPEDDRRNW